MTTPGNSDDNHNDNETTLLNPAAEHVVTISNSLAHGEISWPDTYKLIRMSSPDRPRPLCFYQLTDQVEFDESDEETTDKWQAIVNGIAIMTTINPSANTRSAHNELRAVGANLYLGNDLKRKSPLYAETRLNLFLIATGPSLRMKIGRISRVMHQNHVSFNWREMASLILNDGIDQEATERARRKIAQDYNHQRAHAPLTLHRPAPQKSP